MTEKTLQEGIQAVKGGNFERARRLFNLVVEEDPDSERGWYWLGLIAPDQDKRIACFLRALDINPANQEVRDKLQRLGVPVPDDPELPLTGSSSRPPDQEETGPLPQVPAENHDQKDQRPIPAPEVFQPLEEEIEPEPPDDSEPRTPSLPDTVIVPAVTHDDENLDDLYEQESLLEPGRFKRPSLEGRLLPILVILLVVACASLIYLSTQTGGLPFGLALAPASATPSPTATSQPPTATASPTPQPTSTPTPIPPSPTLTQTFSPLDSLTRLNHLFEQADALTQSGLYSEAIQVWDQALEAAPDEAELYHNRGQSYLALAAQPEQVPVDSQEMLQSALEDATQAILLGPPRGAYYLTSYEILDRMARLETERTRREPILEQMLVNARSAVNFGLMTPFGDPNPARLLAGLGRCQEAMSYLEQQVIANPGSVPLASLYADLARSYLCYGQPRGAILYANMAVSEQDTLQNKWLRAIILYHLGRYNQVLNLLDDLLEENPDAPGELYSLRALVHFQRREYELAEADLDRGLERTPGQAQLAAYTSALLAEHAGDQARAEQQLNLAEQTLSPDTYGPLLDQVRRELGIPLPQRGTPILPNGILNYMDNMPETVRPPVRLFEPDGILQPVRYDGSGAFHLPDGEQLGLHLLAPVPVEILFVDSLTLRLAASAQASLEGVEAALWDLSLGEWVPIDLAPGENPVSDPSRFVNPRGDIYLKLENRSGKTLAVDNLNLTLAFAGQQGTSQP